MKALLEKWSELEPERCNCSYSHPLCSANGGLFCKVAYRRPFSNYEDGYAVICGDVLDAEWRLHADRLLWALLWAIEQRHWDVELAMFFGADHSTPLAFAKIRIDSKRVNSSTHEQIAIALLKAYLEALESVKATTVAEVQE